MATTPRLWWPWRSDIPREQPPMVKLASEREPVVVLTAPWHERDTQSLVERLGVPVFVPPPDTADDLVRKYGLTLEQAAGGSPDVAWLLAGTAARPTCTRWATGFRSASRLSSGESTATLCSGWRASAR